MQRIVLFGRAIEYWVIARLFWIFKRFMNSVERQMISRLLRQRDLAWAEVDLIRRNEGKRLGEW